MEVSVRAGGADVLELFEVSFMLLELYCSPCQWLLTRANIVAEVGCGWCGWKGMSPTFAPAILTLILLNDFKKTPTSSKDELLLHIYCKKMIPSSWVWEACQDRDHNPNVPETSLIRSVTRHWSYQEGTKNNPWWLSSETLMKGGSLVEKTLSM